MTRKFAGAVLAALAALAGLWLMIAPFALGTQPEGASWNSATVTEFFTGLAVTVTGLTGAVAFAAAIRADLAARGLVKVRERGREPEPAPAAPQPSSGELAALLAPLVEALREDLDASGREPRPNGSTPLGVGAEDGR
ncbi:hypothetical protein ACQEUU_03990 [Nonomuraea sp. CA-218870]|uniref:hypothetical protein n=1 Tax=Nonomuraea sp. CA-218870 TaxID=3239998 RepID=UPI003D912FF3